ncbi:MAG: hypothetical protein GEU26_11735 [Nitrososphaeraceae archaeon]|nr:hypothetical protein [Nitrososphaeraceae archaeon]
MNKIIEERIGSLREEVEIGTNVKLNPLYLLDLKDEIVSLRWTTRIISWILDRAIDGQQQLGVTKKRLELEDTKKFENMLDEKNQELEIELEDSNTDREEEILVKEIGNLKCVLGHLFNLKSGGDKTRSIEIAEANVNFQQANRLRKQLIKIQEVKSEISAQIQN